MDKKARVYSTPTCPYCIRVKQFLKDNHIEFEDKMSMKICLISVEIFAWGKYGGFGRATRIIGRELVKRGPDRR